MTDVNQQEPPKIEFPCDYTIRVMGPAAPDFKQFVTGIVKKHAPDHDGSADVRTSRTAKFYSVVVTFRATSENHIMTMFGELKGSGRVHMVL